MKRIISLLVACCLFAGTVVFSADEKSSSDCQAVTIFKALGLTDDSFDGEAYMTRAGFLGLALKAMGKSGEQTAELPYKDVDKTSAYYSDIAMAYVLGIISDSDSFRPDDAIVYEEAAKILVHLLGWEHHADVKGGFYSGYTVIASDLGLFNNLSYRSNAKVSGAEGATMVRNAFEANYIEENYVSGKYTKSDNAYMNDFLDIYKGKGILTSDGLISMDNDSLPEGYIKIDNTVFYYEKNNISGYLGQEIVYYYKKADDDLNGTLLYAEPTPANTVWEINAEDISKDTTVSQVVYNVKNVKKIRRISSDAVVIYNAKAEFAYTKEMLMPSVGSLRLIDRNGNGAADVVISYDYKIAVVNTYNSASNKIIMKFGSAPLRLEDYNFISIVKNGVRIEPSELKEWDVLNMCIVGDRLMATVSAQPASGELEAVGNTGDKKGVVIGGKSYGVSKAYISESGELKPGERGVFYTDIMGDVVCANYSSTSRRNYSVIIKAAMDNNEGTAWFRFFTKNNETESVKCTNKIKINGKTYKPEDAVEAVLNIGLYQLVVTDSNENGELTSIDFAEDKTGLASYKGYDEDCFTLDKSLPSVRYYNNVGGGCTISKDAVFFNIPQDRTNISLYKAEDYKRVYDMDVTISNVKYYDLDRFNRPGCVVISDYDLESPPDKENVNLDNSMFIVSNIYTTVDENDIPGKKLCGWLKDTYKEYWIAENGAHNVSNFIPQDGTTRMGNPVPNNDYTMWGFVGHDDTKLGKGDILQLTLNADDDVVYYRMLWSAALDGTEINVDENGKWGGGLKLIEPGELYEITENPGSEADPNFMSICYTSFGEVVAKEDVYFRYKTVLQQLVDGEVRKYNVERSIKGVDNVFVIELGSASAKVSKSSLSELAVGDKFFMYARDNTCSELMIIRR